MSSNIRRIAPAGLVTACCLLVALAACSGSGSDTGNAKLSVQVSALSEATAAEIASVSVSLTNGTDTLTTTLLSSGGTWTGTATDIPAGAGWVFTGTAADAFGDAIFSGASMPVTITAGQTAFVILELTPVNPPPNFGNHAPHIDSVFVSSSAVGPGDIVQLMVGATDADGDTLTYAWSEDNANGAFTAPEQPITDWSALDGFYGLTITATDPYDAFDAVTVYINVDESNDEGAANVTATINAFPEVQDVVLTTGHLRPGVLELATATATDSDGDLLTYSWSDDCGGTFSPHDDNTAGYVLPPGSPATVCTLQVDVDDGRGGTNVGTLTVIVAPDPSALNGLAASVTAGESHTCAVVDGGAWCWGENGNGELGNNSLRPSFVPVGVAGLRTGVTAIAAGEAHTCALVNGGVWCWGRGNTGQLGNGLTSDSSVPVAVIGLSSGVDAIAAGSAHTCALAAGVVTCWGDDSAGALGDGAASGFSSLPVAVSGLLGPASAIAVGPSNGCAVVAGGVQCWGENSDGQLGDGDTISSPTATSVIGLAPGATAVAIGDHHVCALVIGGIDCWGNNSAGELGNGDTTNSLLPVAVIGGAGATAIAASSNSHSSAVISGAAECWGFGGNGELGNNNFDQSSVPVQAIGASSGATSIASGTYHTCAVVNGGVACWGYGGDGALGNATGASSGVPMYVTGMAP